MFDIGWMELLVIAVVAIVVVGPKDLPRLMRTFGHYAGKIRRMASDFQNQFDQALSGAELEEMQRRYQEAVDMPERVKGPPMLPAPEEARAHPQNQPKETAQAANTTARKSPTQASAARKAASSGTTKKPSATKTGKSTSGSAASKSRTTAATASKAGGKTSRKTAASAKAGSATTGAGKASAAAKPASAKAPPKPGGTKRAASGTAKPRGGAKPRGKGGAKEQSS
ncbi:Sec-independent protein translocase protein TatB [Methyloligella halotolerans]|uniref:Sec-independent protein translocase protein TatB n=1 Tax=Methyloligella halotolerans TaxID=1177755 RepID=A0A1E2S2N1_9HYPH|nr:Sec-independent protein translocase protein TatB [Methyloligella halotolerans]ODA68747.1 Sec-independent protein translocase protein TatB [Methyloligella halotolerans]